MKNDLEIEQELLELLEQEEQYKKYNLKNQYFPDEGKYRRDLYPKHLKFFEEGKSYPERLLIAANRVGKSLAGALEMSYHMSGLYPAWWNGRVFKRPVRFWFAGKDWTVTRDVLQSHLLGLKSDCGTGLIPKYLIKRFTAKPGSPDGIELFEVWRKKNQCIKECSFGNCSCPGDYSTGQFKSYESGVDAYVGAAIDGIQLDEEPPANIYLECLVRTMTTKGFVITTFTPDNGMSETVLSFFKNGEFKEGQISDSKYVVNITWDDVPHLSDLEKEQLKSAMLPHQIEAKTKGIPYLGAGAIYPIAESQYLCDPFPIPPFWPKFYGMDVGWNATAAVWVAFDPQAGIYYVYSEYFRGQAEPSIHAEGIKARGSWINGAIDPASRGKGQSDGKRFLDQYYSLGLILWPADNSVEAGLLKNYQLLSSGKCKIFNTLQGIIGEIRLYRRDEKGNIVKQNDHRLDAFRYAMMTGVNYSMSETDIYDEMERTSKSRSFTNQANPITGY